MPHLLFVDDDEEILELLTRFFRQHGFAVTAASDGTGMFDQLGRQAFDLIVLDVMLPGEDGFSLCRRLRATSRTPIIMLTAMGDHTDRVVGLEIGADDHLGKPFNARELLARVKAVLRRTDGAQQDHGPHQGRKPAESHPAMVFAGWRLDLAKRELRSYDNLLVPLSGGEFDLLLAFAEHPQRVLTRDQLLDLGRGRTSDAFDRSIDVQVSRLRRKLCPDPAQPPIIRTVRNGGYIFTPTVQRA